jgi:hypothetical protein
MAVADGHQIANRQYQSDRDTNAMGQAADIPLVRDPRESQCLEYPVRESHIVCRVSPARRLDCDI